VTTENDSNVGHTRKEFTGYLQNKNYPVPEIKDEHLAVMMQHVDQACELETVRVYFQELTEQEWEKFPWVREMLKTLISTDDICAPLFGFEECLGFLKKWAKKQEVSEDFADYFFSTEEKEPAVLTPGNLKSFGQLFHHYDAPENPRQGTVSFLMMAEKIYKTFGRDAFSVWRMCFLDPSQNWVELLEKKEVDAVIDSINYLANNEFLKQKWWNLVKQHYDITEAVCYSELWNAFKEVLTLIQEKQLTFKEKEWDSVLKRNDLHAVVFLDRLWTVLKKSPEAQPILDHLPEIDWQESGFYHASCQGHRHWDNDLAPKLAEFYSNKNAYSHSAGAWPVELQVPNIFAQALFFVNTRGCLSYNSFIQFKELIRPLRDMHFVRFFTAYVTLGTDSVENITSVQIKNISSRLSSWFIAWFNKNISLEGKLVCQTVLLHFDELIILDTILQELELMEAVSKYVSREASFFPLMILTKKLIQSYGILIA
jgi:hypothetical protein